jgi:nitrate reductase NapE component
MQQKHALVTGCIIIMWLAVLFVGVFGPDFRTESAAGDTVEVPVVWGVALFAVVATAVVGWFGFRE